MKSNVGKNISDWLVTLQAKDFSASGKINYATQFANAADYMDKHVHPDVEKGAAVNDEQDGLFLNNHGPEHIAAVIDRASTILNAAQAAISPYEGYLVLFAIHLHDTGNLLGRAEHEKNCRQIMKVLGNRAGDDELEKRWITRIATAHGGKTAQGGRDTISHLIPDPDLTLLGERVRPQFLAALLRLADELADDRSRASRFALAAGAVSEASEIFHQYSQSLHSVTIGEREIMLDFDFSQEVASKRFLKGGQPTFLLDEIFTRTIKMHTERMYCMRFLRPHIRLDEIRVHIEVFDNDYANQVAHIRYRLLETGYPAHPNGGIHAICPDLEIWSGDLLAERLPKPAGVN
jgi:hypothetical protein